MTRNTPTATAASNEIGPVPTWTPEPVRRMIREIEQTDLTLEQHQILQRLVTNQKMKTVWIELQKRHKHSRELVHRARPRQYPHLRTKDDIQSAALSETFQFTFSAARDRMPVTKPGEIEKARHKTLLYAHALRDVAADLTLALRAADASPIAYATDLKKQAENDCVALLRVANWLEHTTSSLRRPGDPLMVKRSRDDPTKRGVQILIAKKLQEIFGKRLDRTAATLTGVALDVKTSASVARSALTKKRKKRKPLKLPKTK
jgi:hypothetical protein